MTAPFNVGHDAQVNIVDGVTGAVISQFPPTTHFNFEQVTKQETSKPVNLKPLFREIPEGWRGTLEYDRYDPSIDTYFAGVEANYWNSGSYTPATIMQITTEKNGAISQYKYSGVAMKLDSAGTFKASEKVPVKISWMATDRVKVI